MTVMVRAGAGLVAHRIRDNAVTKRGFAVTSRLPAMPGLALE